MPIFNARPLSATHINDAFLAEMERQRPRLGGLYLGMDGAHRYAIMLTNSFKMEIVRKNREEPFSQVIRRLSPDFRLVVNGNYFSCVSRGCYISANLGNVLRPEETNSIGDVISGGRRVLPDRGTGASYAYFGRNSGCTASDYTYGMGNPPTPPVHEGAGGLGPLILKNPRTGLRVRYGDGNRYSSGHTGPASGDPGAHWSACTQRNNETYKSMNSELRSGMGAIGISSSRRFLIALIKPHGTTGSLDSIRDKLWNIGVDGACFLDGSNSVCMAVDRQMTLAPASFKDNLIEVGIGFRRYAPGN